MSTLSKSEAKAFGKTLRWIREAKQMSLRVVTEETGISFQWLHNIEDGTRFNKKTGLVSVVDPSQEIIDKLQRAYRLPPHALDDLLLKARVRSAYATRGISPADTDAVWRMQETRLGELGTPLNTDLAKIVGVILGQPEEVRVR